MINFSSTHPTSHKRCGANKKVRRTRYSRNNHLHRKSRFLTEDNLEQQVNTRAAPIFGTREAHCEADVWPIEAAFQSCAQRLEGRLLVSGLNIEAVRIPSSAGQLEDRPSSDSSVHGGAEHITSQQNEQGMICMRGPQ
jgi:hypothetical protein